MEMTQDGMANSLVWVQDLTAGILAGSRSPR
jgi:hypothetical protein